MYEWQSHTGEAELHIVADSEKEVFADAIDAFGRAVELGTGGEPAVREISVEAADRATLLVELIGELVFLADTEGFVADRGDVRLEDGRLRAALEGRLTRVSSLVKAATYHRLRFDRNGEVWDAQIVLDV